MLTAKNHTYFKLVSILILGGLMAAFLWSARPTGAVTGTSCNNGSQITQPSNNGQIVSGNVNLNAYVPYHLDPVQVKFETPNAVLGTASPANTNNWSMPWDTTALSNQPVQIHARVWFYGTNGSATVTECVTDPIEVIVENVQTTNSTLLVSTQPKDWSGPTNINTQFEVTASLEDPSRNEKTNVTNQADIKWTTTIGQVRDEDRYGVFSSGPSAGTGKVKVTVSYGGQTKTKEILITVLSQEESVGYPYNGTDTSTTDSSEEDTTQETNENTDDTAARTSTERNASYGDRMLESCFRAALGDDFEEIFNSGSRFSFEQLRKSKNCLANRRFVLPANLAPIPPQAVRDLERSDKLAVSEVSQAKRIDESASGIILKGKATPNSSILVYVYSEPLVLAAETDENGNWTYVLEDPLEPGEHEVYVAVEENGEFVRSDSFSFSLAQVAATEDNPSGLSLSLAEADNNLTLYMLSAAGLVAIGLITFMFIIHRKTQVFHHHSPKPESH